MLALLTLLLTVHCGLSTITLPNFLSEPNWVIQRDKPVVIWGKSTCSSGTIDIKINDGSTDVLTGSLTLTGALPNQMWDITMGQRPVSTVSHTMTVTDCDSTVNVNGLLFGDVIVCSGQSNMNRQLHTSLTSEINQVTADAPSYPYIRHWDAREDSTTSNTATFDLSTLGSLNWKTNTPSDLSTTSPGAICYFTTYWMTRQYKEKLGIDVPVAGFNLARGGSAIHEWFPDTSWDPSDSSCGGTTLVPGSGVGSSSNTNYYNRFFIPIEKLQFLAMTWFQGESESQAGSNGNPLFDGYGCAQANLIAMIRSKFGWEVPFGITGLYSNDNQNNQWVFRTDHQQPPAEQMSNVYYVSASDQGQNGGSDDTHPKTKTQVGRRHALKILRDVKGLDNDAQGPVLSNTPFSFVTHASKQWLRVEFDIRSAYNLTFMPTADCGTCCGTFSGFRWKFNGVGSIEDVRQPRVGYIEPGAVYLDLDSRVPADLDEVMLNYEQFAQCTLANDFACVGGRLPATEFHRSGLAGNIPVGTIVPGDVNPPVDTARCPQYTAPVPTKSPTGSPTARPTGAPTMRPTQSPTTATPTGSPTTATPTVSPSKSPTTAQPTWSPTASPTPTPPPVFYTEPLFISIGVVLLFWLWLFWRKRRKKGYSKTNDVPW